MVEEAHLPHSKKVLCSMPELEEPFCVEFVLMFPNQQNMFQENPRSPSQTRD